MCAGRIIQDSFRKKYSYIDIFDLINIPQGFEYFYQAFYIGGKLTASQPGTYDIQIRIEDKKGKLLTEVDYKKVDLIAGEVPISSFFDLVKFVEAGRYYIRVSVDGKKIKDDDKFYFDVIRLGGENGK